MNLLFWTKALLWILHSLCSFGDTKSILHHDQHYPEMAGNQPSCQMTRKLITHHFFCLISFKTHGVVSFARLQREEVSREKKEHGEMVHFLQESTAGLHPLSTLQRL
jgi:hypothetical protein